MKLCCDDMGYAIALKIVTNQSLGPAMKVYDKEDVRYLPIRHCPWCTASLRSKHNPLTIVRAFLFG